MYLSTDFLGKVSVYTINWASVSKFLLISSSSVNSSDDMSFIFLLLFLLHFSHYYYILNNIHSLPLINISRERTNFDAWGYWRFYSRYYRGRAYSLTNAWKLDFLPWNWCRNHVLSTMVVRQIYFQLYGDNIKKILFRLSRILPTYPQYIFYEV